jgi:hypothetical protein
MIPIPELIGSAACGTMAPNLEGCNVIPPDNDSEGSDAQMHQAANSATENHAAPEYT